MSGSVHVSLFAKALSPERYPANREDAISILFYMRYLAAILAGITLGGLGATGGVFIMGFLVINVLSSSHIARYHLRVDESVLNEKNNPVVMEGLVQSCAVFMMIWVIVFNLFHV